MQRKVQTHRLEAFGGKLFGYASLPENADPGDRVVRSVNDAVQALVTLDAHVQQGAPEAAQVALAVALRKAREIAAAAADQLAADKRAFSAPPPATDPAMDAELRAYVRAQPEEARSRLMSEAGRGERPELLHALARLPVPDPLAEQARGLLYSQRTAADPRGALALIERGDTLDWAGSTLAAVEKVVNEATITGTLPAGAVV